MSGWLIIPAALFLAAFAGQLAHLRDRRREAARVEFERITAKLPEEREDLAEVELTPIGARWPDRQTPMLSDLARVDGPAHYHPELNLMQGCEPPFWVVPWWARVDVPVGIVHVHHASDEVADGALTYPGRHRVGDVTAEFHLIIRSAFYPEAAAA